MSFRWTSSLLKLKSRQTALSPRPATKERVLKTPQEEVSYQSNMAREILHEARQKVKQLLITLDYLSLFCWQKAIRKMCTFKNQGRPPWQIETSQAAGQRRFKGIRASGERSLSDVRGQRAERKQTMQMKALSAAAQQEKRQRGTCSRFSPPACSCSLCGCRNYFSFPCGSHIERSLICKPGEEMWEGFFFCQYMLRFLSSLRLDYETTTLARFNHKDESIQTERGV